ncbi:MAG: hypothetical protein M3N98_01125, partial [Actinomycetota bacterium]|nr:hypothetical protein [Actinomycetota bacterium]
MGASTFLAGAFLAVFASAARLDVGIGDGSADGITGDCAFAALFVVPLVAGAWSLRVLWATIAL